METEEWFKLKRYPHIGLPITNKDYTWVRDYVNNPEKICAHSFLPLLHKTIVSRKFRANREITDRTPEGKRYRKKLKNKERKIFYSAHLDALIFSKYNEILAKAYEEFVVDKSYNKCVVAYRKIPRQVGEKGNKCNIEFAKSAFESIANNSKQPLSVIIADFTSFFDNLNHKVLKRQWARVIKEASLPPDHYNVYKSLIKKRFIYGSQLFQAYGGTMIVRRALPNEPKRFRDVRRKINETKFFKEKNAIAYCHKDEFLKNNLNLIVSEVVNAGIPQGSPISATLANVYMIDFDDSMNREVENVSGFYQRYSDDLIIVCERKHEKTILAKLHELAEYIKPVGISEDKTKLYHFEERQGIFKGYEVSLSNERPNFNKTLEYLGFAFDGRRVLMKTSGISKFYRNMKSAFHRRTAFAKFSKNTDQKLFKSKLYKRFTHRGAQRRLFYVAKKTKEQDPHLKVKRHDWGNYISYINKADKEMSSLNGGKNFIKKQSRKFWRKFHVLMKECENEIIHHHKMPEMLDKMGNANTAQLSVK